MSKTTKKPMLTCQICGGVWRQRRDLPPKLCFHCKSARWRKGSKLFTTEVILQVLHTWRVFNPSMRGLRYMQLKNEVRRKGYSGHGSNLVHALKNLQNAGKIVVVQEYMGRYSRTQRPNNRKVNRYCLSADVQEDKCVVEVKCNAY